MWLVGNRPQNGAHPLKSEYFTSFRHKDVGCLSRDNGLEYWRCALRFQIWWAYLEEWRPKGQFHSALYCTVQCSAVHDRIFILLVRGRGSVLLTSLKVLIYNFLIWYCFLDFRTCNVHQEYCFCLEIVFCTGPLQSSIIYTLIEIIKFGLKKKTIRKQ